MVAASICLVGCYAAPNEALVEITCDDFAEHNSILKNRLVAVQGLLVVGLCHNPTTGYEWDWSMSESGIVDETDHHYESTDDEAYGEGGIDVWTFKAVKRGNTTITMEQVRMGLPGEKGPWKLNISVSVR